MKTANASMFIAVTAFLPIAFAQASGSDMQAQGHKSGLMVAQMMGGGMMRGGMMGQSSTNDRTASEPVDPKRADELLAYIRQQGLSCSSCHSISDSGVGPSFAAIAANYAGREDATTTLEDHIANGFRRMPGGLASKSQAAILTKLILDLK